MTTADKVIQAIEARGIRLRKKGNTHRGNSPFRTGSDSNSFSLTVQDGEHGAWKDHVSGEGGSLYTLADKLGIERPRGQATDTKRTYADIADYAQAHGISAAQLQAAGWQETVYANRPALEFQTAHGKRWRFLDGGRPSYINADGYTACWYGLGRALQMDSEYLILCNGEISTVTAQAYGIPACAITSSSERPLPDNLLQELLTTIDGKNLKVIIALDCDTKGRDAAVKIQAQIPASIVVDLGLTDGGDLADFCLLHGDSAGADLYNLTQDAQPVRPYQTGVEIAERFNEQIQSGGVVVASIIQPFKPLWPKGGLCALIPRRKLVGILGASGGGKTTFMETLIDGILAYDEDVIVDSPEWSDEELHARRIQRYGDTDTALTYMDIIGHSKYVELKGSGLYEGMKANLPEHIKPMTEAQRQLSNEVTAYVRDLVPGRPYVFNPSSVKLDVKYIEGRLHSHCDLIDHLRKQGRPCNVIFLDYLQLFKRDKTDGHSETEAIIDVIKAVADTRDVICIVNSQVNKAAAHRAREEGRLLGSQDMPYGHESQFNLLLSLNTFYDRERVYITAGGVEVTDPPTREGLEFVRYGKVKVDLNGKPIETPFNIINVCKNSLGKRNETVRVWHDVQTLRFRALEEYGGQP